jgi:SET domain-containing protein
VQPVPAYVGQSHRHGLGIFAARDIRRGKVIERCPVLVVSASDCATIERTRLRGYLYEWDGDYALALGFGSLYNHSDEANAAYEAWIDDELLVIRAARTIRAGEEITIDYVAQGSPDDLWFEPVD